MFIFLQIYFMIFFIHYLFHEIYFLMCKLFLIYLLVLIITLYFWLSGMSRVSVGFTDVSAILLWPSSELYC